MARHPEVTEQDIIAAGKSLESLGKVPNPGAIRVKLGYRGSLTRIKEIWEKYDFQRNEKLIAINDDLEGRFEELPSEYVEKAEQLISRVSKALEQLSLEAFQSCQRLFDRRIKSIECGFQEELRSFTENEENASKALDTTKIELEECVIELKTLAEQNAKLLIENSELKGRLAVYDDKFKVGE